MDLEAIKKFRFTSFFGKDKVDHYVLGTIVSVVAFALFRNRYLTFLSVLGAGIAVEVYQKVTKSGHVEINDVIATTIGSFPVLFAEAIMSLID